MSGVAGVTRGMEAMDTNDFSAIFTEPQEKKEKPLHLPPAAVKRKYESLIARAPKEYAFELEDIKKREDMRASYPVRAKRLAAKDTEMKQEKLMLDYTEEWDDSFRKLEAYALSDAKNRDPVGNSQRTAQIRGAQKEGREAQMAENAKRQQAQMEMEYAEAQRHARQRAAERARASACLPRSYARVQPPSLPVAEEEPGSPFSPPSSPVSLPSSPVEPSMDDDVVRAADNPSHPKGPRAPRS